MKILILGDGDYSFTLALLRKLDLPLFTPEGRTDPLLLVATSFDSYRALLDKYKDINAILGEIKKFNRFDESASYRHAESPEIEKGCGDKSIRVVLLHNIDATGDISLQLQREFDSEYSSKASEIEEKIDFSTLLFDEVIFNFPHLGFEDCIAHSSMIAHIIHSCKRVMNIGRIRDASSSRHPGSFLTISLVENQFTLWKVEEKALQQSLKLHDSVPLKHIFWSGEIYCKLCNLSKRSESDMIKTFTNGYIFRRHQTGKSFSARVKQTFNYVFAFLGENEVNKTSSVVNGASSLEADQSSVTDSASHKSVLRRLYEFDISRFSEVSIKGKPDTVVTSDNCNNSNISNSDKNSNSNNSDAANSSQNESSAANNCINNSINNGDVHSIAAAPKNAPLDKSERLKKRKMYLFSDKHVRQLVNFDEILWECLVCHKTFASELSCRGHCYNSHSFGESRSVKGDYETGPSHAVGRPEEGEQLQSAVIEDSNGHDSRAGGSIYGSEGGVGSVLFDCLLCSRSFKSKQSLHEHNISKHTPGGFLTSKSELGVDSTRSVLSSSGISYVSDNMIIESSGNSNVDPTISQETITQPPILKCGICDLGFATEAMLERHLTFGWRPVSDDSNAATNHSDSSSGRLRLASPEGHGDEQSLSCHICSKTFKELRARNQHMNYCILKTK